MTSLTQKDIARFWGYVDKENSQTFYNGTRCWEWIAGCTKQGYGEFWVGSKNRRAHRIVCELTFGEIPQGLHVLHHCDNPPCCNPSHLFLGTVQNNMDDMTQKDRQARGDANGSRLHPEKLARGDAHGSRTHPESLPRGKNHWSHIYPENVSRGESNGRAKLTNEKVSEIRKRCEAGESHTLLAKEFGVSQSLISAIVKRKNWI